MILNCPTAEGLSQVAADRGWTAVANHKVTGVTLPGVLELSRSAVTAGESALAAVERVLAPHPTAQNIARAACEMWRGGFDPKRAHAHLFSSPEFELWQVHSAGCLESDEFSLFAHRFQRRLKDSGFGLRFPYALSQALIEMIENVVRHSGPRGQAPSIGVIGYHVVRDEMSYYVGDLGRGVLRSLHENPRWRKILSDGDALVAAAKDGATRSPEQTEGDGFRLAFQGFLDRAGVFAMRSGDGLAVIRGNLNGREAVVGNAAPVRGVRVAAYCSLGGEPRDIPLRA